MEELKSLIPNDLKRMIGESTAETLTQSCYALREFLTSLPQFQRIIGDLTDPELALCRKSKEKALDFKKKGNECFLTGDYQKALSFYSQALRYSPMTDADMDKSFVAALYANRASALYKMSLLEECIRDCDRAITLSPAYSKAWYRRGKANASLKNYGAAICDLEISLIVECSSSGKKQIKEELTVMLSHFNSTMEEMNLRENAQHGKVGNLGEQCSMKLQCVTTPSKGKGMVSPVDVHPSLLLHTEEPIAAIVMKSCRETYCHFCFNELPPDVLFCSSCTAPIYCSQHCMEQAGGGQFIRNHNHFSVQKNLSVELAKHVMDIIHSNDAKYELTNSSFEKSHEHRHECGGAHWPSVLPLDVVLAGRAMVKFDEHTKLSGEVYRSIKTLDFAHNYAGNSPQNKLELHICAIVLSYCLGSNYDSDTPALVLLISQVKVNSMAIVRMKSLDGCQKVEQLPRFSGVESALTSTVEQVQVGKAIYATGSFFNHSCQPNVHAYFLSRTLYIRSTEFIPAWDPLELSYGPQVGQLGFHERQELLTECYSFKCQCRGCSELNLSDILIAAFCCPQPNCLGVVLDSDHYRKIEEVFLKEPSASSCMFSLPQKEDISKVAFMLLPESSKKSDISPKHCLTCGAYRDLGSMRETLRSVMMGINKYKECTNSKATQVSVSDALRILALLRSIRHRYSKTVAEVEDIIAEAFVKVEEFEQAILHCGASIEVLEKLYNANHIVIGHELLKLVSIQLSSGDRSAALCNIKRLAAIFSLYYGSHATSIFPYLGELLGLVEGHAS